MFIFLAAYIVCFLLAQQLCARLKVLEDRIQRTSISAALALIAVQWIPWGLAYIVGVNHCLDLTCLLGIAGLLAVRRFLGGLNFSDFQRLGSTLKRNNWIALTVIVAVICFSGWVQYEHCLRRDDKGMWSAGAAWEDQSWHSTLATSFAYGENLRLLEYPIAPGHFLGYPFLSDFLAGTLIAGGAGIGNSFWITTWIATLIYLLTAYALAECWLSNRKAAAWAVLLSLFAGNAGFISFIRNWWISGDLHGTLMSRDFANDWELGLHYHVILTSVLLVMRTSLFGMPIAFAVFLLLSRAAASFAENLRGAKTALLAAGCLAGALPLIQAHSFLVIGLFCACFFLFGAKMPMRLWLCFGVPALVLAVPQILWIRLQLADSTVPFIRLHPGWMNDQQGVLGAVKYWLWNGGVFLPLVLFAFYKSEQPLKKVTWPLLVLWILGQFVVFQPYVYDNIKLFAFVNLAGAIVVMSLFTRWWTRGRAAKSFTAALFVLSIFSGVLSIITEMIRPWLVLDQQAIEFADAVKANTESNVLILTASSLNHPIAVLTGRRILLGYKGWQQQHGINYAKREEEVNAVYEGKAGAREVLKKYQIEYIAVGPQERDEFKQLNEAFLGEIGTPVLSRGAYNLFRVTH